MEVAMLELKKGKNAFMVSFLWFFAYYAPLFLQEITYVRYLFWVIKISVILWIGLQVYQKKIEWTKFDFMVVAMCGFIMLSGVMNIEALKDTLKVFMRMLFNYLFLRIIIDSPNRIRQKGMEAASWYFCLVCLVNTLQIVVVGGQKFGHYFFLGSDNGCANIYFISVFMAYVRMRVLGRKYTWQFVVAVLSMAIYAFILQVGAVVMSVAGGIFFYLIYWLGGDRVVCIFTPYKLFVLDFGIWISIFVTKLSFLQGVINRFFFNKYGSISSRVELWRYFMIESLVLPLGHGAGQEKYDDMAEGIEKWKLIGNCHNIFVETVYRYGYVTLILFLIICFVAGQLSDKYRKEKIVLGILFFLYLLHGLVEGGVAYSVLYFPFLYYLEKILSTDSLVRESALKR